MTLFSLLLQQLAKGRTVTIASLVGFPDIVTVSLSQGGKIVEQSVCDGREGSLHRLLGHLDAELGG